MKLPYNDPATIGQPPIELSRDVAVAILYTIEAGWVLALKTSNVSVDLGEVEMTQLLRKGMRKFVDSGTFEWTKKMLVLPGTESHSSPEGLVPDGLIDIPILLVDKISQYGHDPHAIIECKRISGNDAKLCRLYVVEGINRYKSGKYALNHSIGFMIGYLISRDTIDNVVLCINNYLRKNSLVTEELVLFGDIDKPWAWSSTHPREKSSKIKMYHAFLSFSL